MPYLKHEMRERFEKHSTLAFFDKNKRLEDGLLEKIISLALANLTPYSDKFWEITAVGSPVNLHRLYIATGEKKIIECAYSLIIFDNCTAVPDRTAKWNIGHEIDMLSLSISCAAKFYCVDYFIIKDPDNQIITREFCAGGKSRAAEIVCLGFFKDSLLPHCDTPVKNAFSKTVRVI